MSLLPETASFEEWISDCFLSLKERGTVLSSADAELLHGWAGQNVPLHVVVRAIQTVKAKADYDARPDQPVLVSLKQCRKEVEKEIRRFRRSQT